MADIEELRERFRQADRNLAAADAARAAALEEYHRSFDELINAQAEVARAVAGAASGSVS